MVDTTTAVCLSRGHDDIRLVVPRSLCAEGTSVVVDASRTCAIPSSMWLKQRCRPCTKNGKKHITPCRCVLKRGRRSDKCFCDDDNREKKTQKQNPTPFHDTFIKLRTIHSIPNLSWPWDSAPGEAERAPNTLLVLAVVWVTFELRNVCGIMIQRHVSADTEKKLGGSSSSVCTRGNSSVTYHVEALHNNAVLSSYDDEPKRKAGFVRPPNSALPGTLLQQLQPNMPA